MNATFKNISKFTFLRFFILAVVALCLPLDQLFAQDQLIKEIAGWRITGGRPGGEFIAATAPPATANKQINFSIMCTPEPVRWEAPEGNVWTGTVWYAVLQGWSLSSRIGNVFDQAELHSQPVIVQTIEKEIFKFRVQLEGVEDDAIAIFHLASSNNEPAGVANFRKQLREAIISEALMRSAADAVSVFLGTKLISFKSQNEVVMEYDLAGIDQAYASLITLGCEGLP